MADAATAHLLDGLSLPTRYETLRQAVGNDDVAQLLVAPSKATLDAIEEAGEAVKSIGEGLFLPLLAPSGRGKTTLASNLRSFLPSQFSPTLTYEGEVTAEALSEAVQAWVQKVPERDRRVLPINIDHREGRKASGAELAEIKRFLRQAGGQQAIILWPTTQDEIATEMSVQSRSISGAVPIDLPISVEGPDRETWQQLAKQTLLLANRVDNLDELLSLDEYSPEDYPSIGDYLRKIAFDFNSTRLRLRRATEKPIKLTIVWASETPGHGILSSLTSSSRFGFLDASALLDATSKSVTGRWWSERRGLLVQTIVRLDAHTLCLPPSVAVTIIRRNGPDDFVQGLADLGVNNRSPAEVNEYLIRSDLGRHLLGEPRSVSETRGNPAETARVAFGLLGSEFGFTGARDKQLNKACAEAIEPFIASESPGKSITVTYEKKLSFLDALLPDNAIEFHEVAHCIEYTWRQGDFLAAKNRAAVAEYVLKKLQNYARELGWVAAG
ncbi:hypothetical protein ACIB24_05780 [Spongisporangium articulatum]|uniref:Uncharacterized protein n=1 Tax=Spongisporangium articulatum TaxID=3362603 RepID=A0ABW8AKQ4_9ACTN